MSPDHLLLGALEAAGKLGVAIFGPLVLDLHGLAEDGDDDLPQAPAAQGPRYAPDTAAVFDRATRIARGDGEPKARLVHILAAFDSDGCALMSQLMDQYGFDETRWRAALAEWDQKANGRDPNRPQDDKVVSVDDAAATLGVHSQTIRGYIRTGRLPAYRIGGERAIRIFASDLYGLLERLEPDSEESRK